MSHAPLAIRVEMVENTVRALAALPDRFEALEERVGTLESQVALFRQETRVEFSAVHTELAALHAADAAIRADLDGLRTELREGFAVTNGRITNLEQRMQELNDDTRRHMLVLHEEVLNRIALIGEGRRRRRR